MTDIDCCLDVDCGSRGRVQVPRQEPVVLHRDKNLVGPTWPVLAVEPCNLRSLAKYLHRKLYFCFSTPHFLSTPFDEPRVAQPTSFVCVQS
ncbi:hypothetical protein MTO96_023447 [Rhipicephalus appendiculatus]